MKLPDLEGGSPAVKMVSLDRGEVGSCGLIKIIFDWGFRILKESSQYSLATFIVSHVAAVTIY